MFKWCESGAGGRGGGLSGAWGRFKWYESGGGGRGGGLVVCGSIGRKGRNCCGVGAWGWGWYGDPDWCGGDSGWYGDPDWCEGDSGRCGSDPGGGSSCSGVPGPGPGLIGRSTRFT